MHRILLTASLFMVACQSQSDLIEDDFGPKPVAAIHADTLTLDTHIDIPLTYMKEIDPSGETDLQVDLPKLQAGALDSGFWIIYTPQGDLTTDGYAQGHKICLLYTSPSPRDKRQSRMPSSA